MKFTNINTQRLHIGRFSSPDAEVLAFYRAHPEVAKFQSAWTLSKAKELIQQMSESDPSEKGKWFQFAIRLKSDMGLIGDIGFLHCDENEKSWIGYTLDPRFWHQGYASEAVLAVISFYKGLGVRNVWASTDPQNTASKKLLIGLGFILVEEKADDVTFVLEA